MKVKPVSADLLIKLSLGVVLLGGVAMLIYTIKSQASAAAGWAANHLDPTNPENVAYGTVNTWGGAIVEPDGAGRNADGSWTLGGWLYDTFNPSKAAAVRDISKPVAMPPKPGFTTYTGGENSSLAWEAAQPGYMGIPYGINGSQ